MRARRACIENTTPSVQSRLSKRHFPAQSLSKRKIQSLIRSGGHDLARTSQAIADEDRPVSRSGLEETWRRDAGLNRPLEASCVHDPSDLAPGTRGDSPGLPG
jgi:hypothetical protein